MHCFSAVAELLVMNNKMYLLSETNEPAILLLPQYLAWLVHLAGEFTYSTYSLLSQAANSLYSLILAANLNSVYWKIIASPNCPNNWRRHGIFAKRKKKCWSIAAQLFRTHALLLLIAILLPEGSGPIPEVLQYRANPWGSRSKLLHLPPVPKISLISMSPDGGRIRY